MRVLVTGSAGFLGRHVARHLLASGFDVAGFDRLPSLDPQLPGRIGDLSDLAHLERAARGNDVICHIGAIGDIYLAAANPPLAAVVNVAGSAHVAEVAAQHGCRVVYASTWEVYGKPRYEPMDEDHPCQPDHPYNITKLAGERILLAADRLRGVPVLALRLGTAYGPGLRPNSVFRLFIDRARRGEPINIQGDGSQSRQFTHVADIARAFELACRSHVRGMELNTTATEQISIKQLAERVVARVPTEINYSEPRAGDVASAWVSSERIKSTLGWEAVVAFEDGLDELIDRSE